MVEEGPVGDARGPDVDDETEIRIVTEVEFAARCLIHGTQKITSQPRVLNLGYGRAVVDLGRTTCLVCGHANWVTIELYDTNWDKATVAQLQRQLRLALAEQYGSASVEEEEEEEDPRELDQPEQPEPGQRDEQVDGQRAASPFGDRRSL